MLQNSIYYLIYLNNHFWHFQIGYIWCNILVTLVVHELHLEAVLILFIKLHKILHHICCFYFNTANVFCFQRTLQWRNLRQMGVAYFNLWIQQGLPIANIMGMSTLIPCFGDARKGKVQFGNVQLELLQLEFILKIKLAIICIHQLILVKGSWIKVNLYRTFWLYYWVVYK